MNDSHKQKSDLDISTIVKDCRKELNNDGPTQKSGINRLPIVDICHKELNNEPKITSNTDINVDEQVMKSTRSPLPASTRVMPPVTINQHLDSCFVRALGVEVTDVRWKHLMYDCYSQNDQIIGNYEGYVHHNIPLYIPWQCYIPPKFSQIQFMIKCVKKLVNIMWFG